MTAPVPGEAGYALFDTTVGRCGIGWAAHGIAAVQLPETTEGGVQASVVSCN
jgi:methylated-DNA-[protein]-cysteine S-methyltransferase